MARLKVKYNEEIAPALMQKFQYKSVMQIPQIAKVIVNVGCGESKNNAKEIEAICKDIATITSGRDHSGSDSGPDEAAAGRAGHGHHHDYP